MSFDIVIMAGGRGSRLGGIKKPFLNLCGRRLIDVVLGVAKSIKGRRRVYVCLREEDRGFIHNNPLDNMEIVTCPGSGYVEDLNYMFSLARFPILVLPADMPFLSIDIVERFIETAQVLTTDVVTLMACRNSICRETGISFFRKAYGYWVNIYFDDAIELMDIDTYEDFDEAKKLCASMVGIEGLD